MQTSGVRQTGGDIVLCAGSRGYLLHRRTVEKKGSRVKKERVKGEKNKVKGERHMLQGEHDRVQGEHKRFWKGGKEGSKGWEKKDGEKNIGQW